VPSYSYEDEVYERWKSTGILEKMDAKKKVHSHPRPVKMFRGIAMALCTACARLFCVCMLLVTFRTARVRMGL
jgi:hypothetical protein